MEGDNQEGESDKQTIPNEPTCSKIESEPLEKNAEINEKTSNPTDHKTEKQVPTSDTSLSEPNESLSLICAYGGDESESEETINADSANRPKPVINTEKSDFSKLQSSSSSSESSDESSSDNNSECEALPVELPRQNRLKQKDPLDLDNLPPIENLTISVKEEECRPAGKIYSIVDRLVVVESLADAPALMLDTVLFNRDGKPIGQIYDVFGHIKKPFYSIRFNKHEDISSIGLEVGKVIYCAPKTEHTKYVFTSQLLKEKGSDASWIGDDEPPAHCLDYSDDEEEKKAKKKISEKKNDNKEEKEDDDDVLFVSVEQNDSPARKRYLSFEEQMNRNNTLRTKAYKRAACKIEKPWDGGWHNYKRNNGAGTIPKTERNREFMFERGAVYRPRTPGTPQWNQPYTSQPNQLPMNPSVFQFGNTAAFSQMPPYQNFPQFPNALVNPTQSFPSGTSSQFRQNLPQNFVPLNPYMGSNSPQSFSGSNQPIFSPPRQFQYQNPPPHFQSPPPNFQTQQNYPNAVKSPPRSQANCKCYPPNRYSRQPFSGFVSSPPPMQFPNFTSPPPSFPFQRPPFPNQPFMGNFHNPNYPSGLPPPPPGT